MSKKGLQSVKYSLLQYPHEEKNFSKCFLKSPVSRVVPKKLKSGAFGSFRTTILLQNRKKLKEGPFGNIEKNCGKKSHKAGITYKKKYFGQGRDSNPRPSACRPKKA